MLEVLKIDAYKIGYDPYLTRVADFNVLPTDGSTDFNGQSASSSDVTSLGGSSGGSGSPSAPLTPSEVATLIPPASVGYAQTVPNLTTGEDRQTDNFVTGVSGWRIKGNGDVEFNNGTFRGALTAATIDIGGADATSFHVDINGNLWSGGATFATGTFTVSNAGAVTATSGTIAGWTLSTTDLSSVSGGNTTSMSSGVTSFLSGPTGAPTFSVTRAGVVTAVSGTIGGWILSTTVLRSGATDAASNVLIDSANSLIRLGPTSGNYLTLDGANLRIRSSNYATGVSGFTIEPTLVEAENIIARGIMKGSTFQYDIISAVGGQVYVSNSDVLASPMTALDASTLTTRGTTSWAVNDIMVMRSVTALGIQEEVLRVTAIGSAPTYTVTRDLAGSFAANTNPIWQAGTTVTKQGKSDGAAAYSGGWLRLIGEGTNAPFYSVIARTGVAYNAYTEQLRMGNLNGYLGYVADIFGLGVGSSTGTNANITIDPTNGIRVRNGTTNVMTIDNAGNATFSGSITATTGTIGGFTIGATTIAATNLTLTSGAANTANITVGTGANAGGFNSANSGTDIFWWGGSTFANRATAPIRATAGGSFVATNATITGYLNGLYAFGGDGTDGALHVTGTTTLNTNQVYNYTSITIDGGATLTFTGQGAALLNCSGNVSIAGTINLRYIIETQLTKATHRDNLKSSQGVAVTYSTGGTAGPAFGGAGFGASGGTSTTASGTPGAGGAGGAASGGTGTAGSGGNSSVGGGGGGGGGESDPVFAGTAGSTTVNTNGGNGGNGGGASAVGAYGGGGGGGGGGYNNGTGGTGGNGGVGGDGGMRAGGGGVGGNSGANSGDGGTGGNGGAAPYGNGVGSQGANGGNGYDNGGAGGNGGNSTTSSGGSGGSGGYGKHGTGGTGGTGGSAAGGGGTGGTGGAGYTGGTGGTGGNASGGGAPGQGGIGGAGSSGSAAIALYCAGTMDLTGCTVNGQGGNGGAGGPAGTGGSGNANGGAGGRGGDGSDVVFLSVGAVTGTPTVNNNGGTGGTGGAKSGTGTVGATGVTGANGQKVIVQINNT